MIGVVSLRDVTETDLPTLFEHQIDPVANRLAAFPARGREEFMAHWTKILADETVSAKTILFDRQVVGNVVSFNRHGAREVGYWIDRQYWGKGIATQALAEFLGHVTARPLYARVAKQNVASIRVLEKCGFAITAEAPGPSSVPDDGVEEVVLKL